MQKIININVLWSGQDIYPTFFSKIFFCERKYKKYDRIQRPS